MIVASIASLASRRFLLQATFHSIVDQVDRVNVYLNGYPRVPGFLAHPKVYAVLSRDVGWRGAESKLWFSDTEAFKENPRMQPDDVHVLCDDDIVYPKDYVQRMQKGLADHPGAVVCIHGSLITEPIESYGASRKVFRFLEKLDQDRQIHIGGTGTIAYVLKTMPIRIDRDFRLPNMADVFFALVARDWNVPIWALSRPANWLSYMQPPEGTTIYEQRAGAGNDAPETELLRQWSPWPEFK